jgi:hypothetical protein
MGFAEKIESGVMEENADGAVPEICGIELNIRHFGPFF